MAGSSFSHSLNKILNRGVAESAGCSKSQHDHNSEGSICCGLSLAGCFLVLCPFLEGQGAKLCNVYNSARTSYWCRNPAFLFFNCFS